MKVAIAQINLHVGNIDKNKADIIAFIRQARDDYHADLIIFPELAISGYPPEDLLLRPSFFNQIDQALQEISAEATGIAVITGYPCREKEQTYNTCALLRHGKVANRYFKKVLPNYGVFDEKRYFQAGAGICLVDLDGIPAAISICEDLWTPEHAQVSAAAGARLLININASPYHYGKESERDALLKQRVRDTGLAVIYVNLVGGQDELVFDGGSMAIDSSGNIEFRAPQFEQGLYLLEVNDVAGKLIFTAEDNSRPPLTTEAAIYQALVLGVRDYVHKNGFTGAVIGLSGGIDSALTFAIAVDALGAENVEVILMPSRYTADMSIDDAREMAERLDSTWRIIPIEKPFTAFTDLLAPVFAGLPVDITEENIQARCRGLLLMAISNKTGKLVLTTGNKSEVAVGYATLYGDMAGGFAPLKDVSKRLVYALSRWRNTLDEIIPERIIERPPSAELRPDQKDEDSLPPYDILDQILERYIELDNSPEEIISAGFSRDLVYEITRMVDQNEYKRRQAAPGVKITKRAFGRDRRYPITSGYRER
jgi:NAD+ synthase (glutamine-hydrolysing)